MDKIIRGLDMNEDSTNMGTYSLQVQHTAVLIYQVPSTVVFARVGSAVAAAVVGVGVFSHFFTLLLTSIELIPTICSPWSEDRLQQRRSGGVEEYSKSTGK